MVERLVERHRGADVTTVVTYGIEVDAPPEEVWAVVANPKNLPLWDRHIESVEGVPDRELRAGDRYTTVARFVTVRAHVDAHVLEREPPYRSVIHLSGILDATVTTIVEPLPDDQSFLEHLVEYRFAGGPLGEFAARSLRLLGGDAFVLRHGTQMQKRQIEAAR